MNLSNLVHGRKVRQPVAVDYLSEEQFEQQKYQTQNPGYFNDNSFAGSYAQPPQSYSYVQVPQPPPSPPMEEIAKCSLPSISSLLGIADNNPSQQQEQSRPMSQHTSDGRKNSAHYTSSSAATTPRQSLPLTPPTHPDSAPESRHSPSSSISSTSQYSCASTPAAYCFQPGPTANLAFNPEREGFSGAEARRASVPLSQPQYGLPSSAYPMAPAPQMNGYYPPTMPGGQPPLQNGVYYQQRPPLLNNYSTQHHPPQIPGNTTTTSPPPPPASPSRRTATSAQPATKPSRAPPASRSTATATQAKSPSAVPSADAARSLACGAT
ncbi:hypothetical protein V497_03761 [Pseudogymnoascus sp. VKM F-4516 (FW-969)]|nr:hypothetical protein V497_03761 [Pseudogymnoascus sp. VKM F-4516 (FW-969)]